MKLYTETERPIDMIAFVQHFHPDCADGVFHCGWDGENLLLKFGIFCLEISADEFTKTLRNMRVISSVEHVLSLEVNRLRKTLLFTIRNPVVLSG